MIIPMQQVVIAMRRRESEDVITALQTAGVVHLKRLSAEGTPFAGHAAHATSEDLKEAERLLTRLESTIAALDAQPPAGNEVLHTLPPRSEWAARTANIADPADALERQRAEVRADLDAASAYAEPAAALSRIAGPLQGSRRLAVLPFTLPEEADVSALQAALNEALPERYALAVEGSGAGRVGALAVLKADRDAARTALGHVHLGELRLPGRFEGIPLTQAADELGQIRASGRDRLGALDAECERLAAQHGPELYALRDALKDEVAIHDVRNMSARGRYSLVMQGYVPAERVSELEGALRPFGDGVVYEVHPVDEYHDEDIPVALKNSSYVQPFQLVMGLMSPPKYGTFDPTWVVAIFFPLFFGIIIADIGYGLLFLWFGLWALGKARRNEAWDLSFLGMKVAPNTMRELGFITNVLAAWTIAWGFLTGEFFGTLLEQAGFFYFDPQLFDRLWGWTGVTAQGYHPEHIQGLPFHLPPTLPIVFPRLETELFSNIFLVFSLCFGILQVLWGWGIRIQQGVKHKDPVHTWEGIALFSGVAALVLLGFVSGAGSNFGAAANFSNPLTILMWLGFAGFVVGWLRVIKQYPLLPIELLSQGGSVVSYARIFAVGLVSALLAKLSTELGLSLGAMWGLPGLLLGLVVGVLLHAVILALTLIGHILQPIRLHIVEFLNPTGYNNETSPVYSPLRRRSQAAAPASAAPAAGEKVLVSAETV